MNCMYEQFGQLRKFDNIPYYTQTKQSNEKKRREKETRLGLKRVKQRYEMKDGQRDRKYQEEGRIKFGGKEES